MNNDWTDTLRDTLADHTETPPEGLWQDIEAKLDTPRKAVAWPWYAAAACVALILTFALRPQEEGKEVEIAAVKEAVTGAKHEAIENSIAMASTATPAKRRYNRSITTQEAAEEQPKDSTIAEATKSTVPSEEPIDSAHFTETKASIKSIISNNRPFEPEKQPVSSRRIALNVYATQRGIGGTSPNSQDIMQGGNMFPSISDPDIGTELPLQPTGPLPGYTGDADKTVEKSASHSLPVRLGISLSCPLSSHLTLNTGLAFTRLRSHIDYRMGKQQCSMAQTLLYVGLPVSINGLIYQGKSTSVYLTGGGMAEICAYGNATLTSGENFISAATGNVREHRPQFSVFGGAGVQYDFSRYTALFLEPQLNYCFDNGSSVTNIYKDHPLNFDLSIGLRFKLK